MGIEYIDIMGITFSINIALHWKTFIDFLVENIPRIIEITVIIWKCTHNVLAHVFKSFVLLLQAVLQLVFNYKNKYDCALPLHLDN